jgi:hypothetical protein
MKVTLITILLLSACSFRPENKDLQSKEREQSQYRASSLDSDGDGVSDVDENQSGADAFIADIPTFEGDFFDEMKVKVDFYNKSTQTYQSIDWGINDEKIKFSWEEEERKSPPGGPYMDALLKGYATGVDFKKNNFKFFDYNEGVFSYSSPILFEDSLYSISSKLLSLQRLGFEINRAEAVIRSKFKIASKKFVSFRNPVFDVYYKSKNREGLVFIESKRIDGTYSFNEDNEIFIQFENFDSKIINEGLLSGGASYFLKLRDFTVYDTDQSYSSILEKVQSVSVPVTISYPESENSQKSKVETIYVGIGGQSANLKSVLKKAVKDDLLMTESSIDQIRRLSNRQRSYGNSGQNETLKWYVGSSEIEDNIYSYQFRPNQGIGLAYLSNKKTEKMPIFVSRTVFNNGTVGSSGLLPGETRGIKVKIVSQKILTPFEKNVRVKRPDCGRGSWQKNEVTYNKIVLDYKNQSDKVADFLQKDGVIKISSPKGRVIEGNIGSLIKEGLLILLPSIHPFEFEFSLSAKLSRDFLKERAQISIEILLHPTSFTIRNGFMTKISEDCRYDRIDPYFGAEGGHGGGMDDFKQKGDFSGVGVNWQEVEREYDLDLHVFSY